MKIWNIITKTNIRIPSKNTTFNDAIPIPFLFVTTGEDFPFCSIISPMRPFSLYGIWTDANRYRKKRLPCSICTDTWTEEVRMNDAYLCDSAVTVGYGLFSILQTHAGRILPMWHPEICTYRYVSVLWHESGIQYSLFSSRSKHQLEYDSSRSSVW